MHKIDQGDGSEALCQQESYVLTQGLPLHPCCRRELDEVISLSFALCYTFCLRSPLLQRARLLDSGATAGLHAPGRLLRQGRGG